MTHITVYREKNIRDKWPMITDGVSVIASKFNGYRNWSHVHVMGELLQNPHCRLYIIEKNDIYAGFMVVRLFPDEFSYAPVFLVWLLYLKEQGILDDVLDFAKSEAKRLKCKVMRFESNRAGWEKVVARHGGKMHLTTYQKEI
jgi:hypothetical protein